MNDQRIYAYILLIFVFSCLTTSISCQEISINPATVRFAPIHDATKISENCYQITPNKEKAGGGLWYPEPIDLRKNFHINMEIFLGCADSLGADGMVLMFCQKKILGGRGAGMGYLNLKPSLGIEFDTYQNITFGDPKEDHIAILENGFIHHTDKANRPVFLAGNLEDCQYHPMSLDWNANTHLLSITLDGEEIIRYKKDLIKEIFRGKYHVNWGVSAATGSDHNAHKICFNELKMEPVKKIQEFTRLKKANLKRGNFVALDKITFKGNALTSDLATNTELEKLINFLKSNTEKHLDIFSHVHDSSKHQESSIQRAVVLKKYLVSKGINEDRLTSKGVGNQYLRSRRDLMRGLNNTRIEIYLFEPLP